MGYLGLKIFCSDINFALTKMICFQIECGLIQLVI